MSGHRQVAKAVAYVLAYVLCLYLCVYVSKSTRSTLNLSPRGKTNMSLPGTATRQRMRIYLLVSPFASTRHQALVRDSGDADEWSGSVLPAPPLNILDPVSHARLWH